MVKVFIRLLLVLIAGFGAGSFSVLVNTSAYVQFAMWAALLAALSLLLLGTGFSILESSGSGILYSTIYVVAHGLLETYVKHKHETLAGWIFMLVVYNLITALSVWLFLRRVTQLEQLQSTQHDTEE